MRKKKSWYKGYCRFIGIFKHKPKIIYLGDQISDQAIILSNHVGALGPLTFELNHEQTFRLWGTHEMNGSLRDVYRYLSRIYFLEKKHKNKFLSRLYAFIACPFMKLFYRGLDLLPTYHDARLFPTIKDSYNTLMEHQSVIIFPENSDHGYFDELKEFHAGFVVLCEYALKKGLDLPIYTTYLDKKNRVQLFDNPILFSEIKSRFESKEEIAEYFCKRCNELSKIIKEKYSKKKKGH